MRFERINPPLCLCGCGRRVNRRGRNWSRFVSGHNGRLTEFRKRISEEMRIKMLGPDNPMRRSEVRSKHLSSVRDPERRRKHSLTMKGNQYCLGKRWHLDLGQRQKRSMIMMRENNPMYGKSHTDESCRKISEHSANRGKHLSDEVKKKISEGRIGSDNPFFGRKHTDECLQRISELLKGDKNPAWLGGKSFEPYTEDWTSELRGRIKERDHYRCCLCRQLRGEERLDIHHIDYDKKNCDDLNLITLCSPCHARTNVNRIFWENYFKEEMGRNDFKNSN